MGSWRWVRSRTRPGIQSRGYGGQKHGVRVSFVGLTGRGRGGLCGEWVLFGAGDGLVGRSYGYPRLRLRRSIRRLSSAPTDRASEQLKVGFVPRTRPGIQSRGYGGQKHGVRVSFVGLTGRGRGWIVWRESLFGGGNGLVGRSYGLLAWGYGGQSGGYPARPPDRASGQLEGGVRSRTRPGIQSRGYGGQEHGVRVSFVGLTGRGRGGLCGEWVSSARAMGWLGGHTVSSLGATAVNSAVVQLDPRTGRVGSWRWIRSRTRPGIQSRGYGGQKHGVRVSFVGLTGRRRGGLCGEKVSSARAMGWLGGHTVSSLGATAVNPAVIQLDHRTGRVGSWRWIRSRTRPGIQSRATVVRSTECGFDSLV